MQPPPVSRLPRLRRDLVVEFRWIGRSGRLTHVPRALLIHAGRGERPRWTLAAREVHHEIATHHPLPDRLAPLGTDHRGSRRRTPTVHPLRHQEARRSKRPRSSALARLGGPEMIKHSDELAARAERQTDEVAAGRLEGEAKGWREAAAGSRRSRPPTHWSNSWTECKPPLVRARAMATAGRAKR